MLARNMIALVAALDYTNAIKFFHWEEVNAWYSGTDPLTQS